ncbi:calcium-binding and coiled-coil domain-containing protein 2 [Phalacrocorax carbo]|uniref:calcium-binding and coiled-coil domain-containing protein 2 n=1 Tax=Phalacrocorax carbo TaxID=9209 RepID=UPI00311984DF
MDETPDEPPTSAVILDNCHFSQVIFNNVEKFYVPGGDVNCHYTLTQNIVPRGKDWVGIFRVGWKTTRDYYTFMWAPLPSGTPSNTAVQQQIQFKAYYLPKDDEYYQFCYIDQDGMIRGASVPFQFRADTEDDILVVTTEGEVEEIELRNKNLCKENEELKASCASLQKQNTDLQEELSKTQELQNSLETLRSNTEKLELELNSLKKENKRLKELDDCRGAELQRLKEQIKNVTVDKESLETRLKTALDHLDQLQVQVLIHQKEVESLSRTDCEKTEQLENLKEENRQLRMSRTQQELQNSLETLRSNTEKLELELNSLKKENKRLKELDDCRGAELQRLKEQIKNVTVDKESLETRLKTALDHLDQLQVQVLIYQKEVESLSRTDCEKTEQLENLKEENRQLRMSRTQQKLREENDELLRHLSQTREVSAFSVASEAQAPIPAPEVEGLLFGNPYCVAGANLGAGAADVASIRKCPMCDEVFPEDIETSQYEAHVRSHLLECPLCSEAFEKSKKQVFDDHILCHGLE